MKETKKEININELTEILGLTIKKDDDNKIITFLCMLSAYTEGSQFNVSFNAPSSAGKSFVAMEIAKLFPQEDVLEYAYASPASFFHDSQPVEGQEGVFMNDLSRKVILFLDMPDTTLLARMRPVLSHDKKIIETKITDRTEKKGMRTKRILIKGYPSVVFCSAGLKMDEQESTRLFLLSPEISQEKIEAGINQTIKKEADNDAFKAWLDSNPERVELMKRIIEIKNAQIDEIKLENPEIIRDLFMKEKNILKPRHQRDVKRFISLVKAHALLNLFNRRIEGKTLYATDEDARSIFPLWARLSKSQELNLPPYVYELYSGVFEPAYAEKNKDANDLMGGDAKIGLTRNEILQKHFNVYGRHLSPVILSQQILPILEACGLIVQESDPNNLRQKLIFISTSPVEHITEGGGVNIDDVPLTAEDIGF
jgi:hypothetical protein